MLVLQNASLQRGHKILLEDASVQLFEKQKIGLVGHNGCGKSSLFSLILGKLELELGSIQLQQQLRISHLSQQIPDSQDGALDFVLAGDKEYIALQEKITQAESAEDHEALLHCHEALNQSGGYAKPALAASIMHGLGFDSNQQTLSVNSFSGGWRMRLALARCLMTPADLILLDEPTNHLDMEAILWLEKFLKQSPSTIIIISHDRDFLDGFVSHILHVDHKKLRLYNGNYSFFEKTRAEQLALQQATYEKQQKKIAHMMDYVDRFRYKASKAKQAQSRLKAIERMDKVAQAQFDSPFSFNFLPCPRAGNPLIRCDDLYAGYEEAQPVLKRVNLLLNPGDRIALLGPNGMGKSTLIKTLIQEIAPLRGVVEHHRHLRIGYYAQHTLDSLDCSLSPIETIQRLSPEAREQSIRDFLGGFDFKGTVAESSAQNFSGGEKARLALAKLVWQAPNILFLDEPTNHLDLGMRAAIEIALQSYEGALVLISHDRHLLKSSVDAFYLIYKGSVEPFKGDLDDYHAWLQKQDKASTDTLKPQSSAPVDYKEKKRLQNRMKSLETQLDTLHKKHAEIQHKLADPTLYEEESQQELARLQARNKELAQAVEETEEEWMMISEKIEGQD